MSYSTRRPPVVFIGRPGLLSIQVAPPTSLQGIPRERWAGLEGPCLSYQLTDDDLLWMARAAQCEGGDPAATIWTWATRFMYRTCKGSGAPTLGEEVRRHSQPVNAIWQRDGSRCRPGGTYHGRDECSEARLRRRDECAGAGWDEISPEIRGLVLAFARGTLDNPVPGSVDFAVPRLVQAAVARKPGSRILLRSGNWYMSYPDTNDWGDQVRLVGGGGRRVSPAAIAVPIVAVSVAAGLAAYAAYANA